MPVHRFLQVSASGEILAARAVDAGSAKNLVGMNLMAHTNGDDLSVIAGTYKAAITPPPLQYSAFFVATGASNGYQQRDMELVDNFQQWGTFNASTLEDLTLSFADLEITLFDDSTFSNNFSESFASQMAASAAPDVGYTCGSCPEGFVGDGINCEVDQCSSADFGGCDPLVNCTSAPGGGVVCGSCPQGYDGDGTSCEERDECAINNGDCDYRTNCTNTVGGWECGACPAGYLGSGLTGCMQATGSCEVDNGGTGATGCVDEDGCLEMACYPGVHCEDVAAPGTGAACGSCPAGMIGDGVSCSDDPCWYSNGGCDLQVDCTADDTAAMGRVCGSCPEGTADYYEDGTWCREVDGCAQQPCHANVRCTDVAAPGEGYVCGDCPEGLTGDGELCEDVDECADGGVTVCDVLTACVNLPGGFECSDCPQGYMGSGLTGCTPSTDCTDNNGGCDPLTSCFQEEGALTECGECPEGYSGTGSTGCSDADGCKDAPCFVDAYGAATECRDVPAPETGHECGPCPEGYAGNGTVCEACTMEVLIVDSSVVSGVAYSSQEVQIVGKVMDVDPECTNTAGREFEWKGSSSSTGSLELTAETHRAHTLTLQLPADSLTAHVSYTVKLTASMVGAPHTAASADMAFYVDVESLEALITGGGGYLGEDSLLTLDASSSNDPAGDPTPFAFSWQCSQQNGDRCRQRDGTLLPSTLTDAILQIFLQGDADGRSHTFKLTASKGDRSSSLYTTVTVGKGAPPVPAIMPIPGKVNTGAALTMQASVAVGNSSGASSLWWSAYQQTEGAEGDIVDLLADAGVLASESRSGSTLVLHPNALAENTTYVFELEAVSQEDGSVGRSSAKVVTNTPPSGGQLLVTPTTGTVLQTEYTVNTSGWEDTDLPLFSSFSYRVIGDDTRAGVILSAVGPQQVLTLKMPESGLEEFGSVVEVAAHVEDRYGCKANPVLFNITVMAVEFTSDSEMHDFVDSTVSESETLLSNGQAADALNSITGSISILADEEIGRRRRHRRAETRQASSEDVEEESSLDSAQTQRTQRESMSAMIRSAHQMLPLSTTVQTWVASTALELVHCPPEETSTALRQNVLQVYNSILEASVMESGVPLNEEVAGQILMGLSNITEGLETDGAVMEAFGVLQDTSAALRRTLSAGQQPTLVTSEHHSMRIQRDSLAAVGGTYDRLLETSLATPGGQPPTNVNFPVAILQNVLDQTSDEQVDTELLITTTDPHVAHNSSCGGSQQEGCHRLCSPLTTISMLTTNGTELSFTALTDPVILNFTIDTEKLHKHLALKNSSESIVEPLHCTFWDPAFEQYSSDGCVSLPNPAPPNSTLYWNEEAWEAIGVDDDSSIDLEDSWGLQHAYLMEGCNERNNWENSSGLENTSEDATSSRQYDNDGGKIVLVISVVMAQMVL
ncbi:hypothetical protein CYMTET_17317 [Cymbomonas tetramitiformis]|uniref:EGF-like domain-containing protein n=1 Tax=Cymbomonas tetramitiformis TaxID=36881 RepID=A0AAE0GAD4_9CHLO|nr:hypothetical protein CYMTET_17317 [Cymbomonas tetramitiformis]